MHATISHREAPRSSDIFFWVNYCLKDLASLHTFKLKSRCLGEINIKLHCDLEAREVAI